MRPTHNNLGFAPSDDSWLTVDPSTTSSEPSYVLSSTDDPYYVTSHRNHASTSRGSNTTALNTRPRTRHIPTLFTEPERPDQIGNTPPRRTPTEELYLIDDNTSITYTTTTISDSPSPSPSSDLSLPASLNSTWDSRSDLDSSDPTELQNPNLRLPPIWSPSLDLFDTPTGTDTATGMATGTKMGMGTSRRAGGSGGGATETGQLSTKRLTEISGFYEDLRRARDKAEWSGEAIEPGASRSRGWGRRPRSRFENLEWGMRREMGRLRGGSG